MSNILQAIADAIDALCDPYSHSEPRWEWDKNGHRVPLKPHVTTQPGLIQQLRNLAEPGAAVEAGSNGYSESAPAAVDAVSLLGAIEHGAEKRLADAIERGARVDRRQGAEDCLRALAGLAGQFTHSRTRVDPYLCPGCVSRARPQDPADDPYWGEFIARAESRGALAPEEVDALLVEARQGCAPTLVDLEHWAPCHRCVPTVQTELLAEVRSWQWQADIIAGWRTPPRILPAPCPGCEAKGTLLAYADPDNPQAKCTGCGRQWSKLPSEHEGQIEVLAKHVIDYAGRTREQRDQARAEAVAERRRRSGEQSGDTPTGEPVAELDRSPGS